jgi:hypothetical protein
VLAVGPTADAALRRALAAVDAVRIVTEPA